jgi:hypothetical protein
VASEVAGNILMNFHIDRVNVADISATSSVFPSPEKTQANMNEINFTY